MTSHRCPGKHRNTVTPLTPWSPPTTSSSPPRTPSASGVMRAMQCVLVNQLALWKKKKKKEKKRKTKIRICTICQFPRCKHSHHGRFQLTGGLTADSQHFRIFNNQLLQTRRGQLQHVLNSPAPENPQITPRVSITFSFSVKRRSGYCMTGLL